MNLSEPRRLIQLLEYLTPAVDHDESPTNVQTSARDHLLRLIEYHRTRKLTPAVTVTPGKLSNTVRTRCIKTYSAG